jgi:hypothetical protein
MSINSEYLRGPLATLEERMVGAYIQDPSLCYEMCALLGSKTSFKDDVCASEDPSADWPQSDTEKDFKEVSRKIWDMQQYRDKVRGDPYNEKGSLKTPAEYMEQWSKQGICFVQ